jgi:hypothetical protein
VPRTSTRCTPTCGGKPGRRRVWRRPRGGPHDPGTQRGNHNGGQGEGQGRAWEERVEAGGTGVGEAEGPGVECPRSDPRSIATGPPTQGNPSGGVRDWLGRGHRGPEGLGLGGLRQGDLGGCREADPQGERRQTHPAVGARPTGNLSGGSNSPRRGNSLGNPEGGGRQGEMAAIWGSPSCVEGSGAQAMNKGKEGGAGPHAGKPFSAVHDDGVNA